MRLSGKSIAVTGAAGGLGSAIVRGLLDHGADRVFALDVPAQLERADVGTADAVPVDITDPTEVARTFDEVISRRGGLDGMVVAAGIQLHKLDGPISDVDLETWQRTLDVNLTGAFLTLKHAVPLLVHAERSSVVLIGSPTGLTMNGQGYSAYAASKAGMMALARVVAADYAAQGLRANVIVPGTMRTPLIEELLADAQRRAALEERIPAGRLGEPRDLVGLVNWLVSDESAFATGAFYPVDGGLTAR